MKHWGLNDNIFEHDTTGQIKWFYVLPRLKRYENYNKYADILSLKWNVDRFRFWAIYCHKYCPFMKMVPADNFEAYNEYWLILLRHSIVTSIQEGMSATLWFRERHIITFLPCNSWYFGTLQGVKMQSIYRYLCLYNRYSMIIFIQ